MGPVRSVYGELLEGSTDGKYKKVVQNRGGEVDLFFYLDRAGLDDQWYGIHEQRIKVGPSGRMGVTPNYVATHEVLPYD